MVFENITHRKFNGINVSEHHEFSHEKVFYYEDEETDLKSIIAIHSSSKGPAIGGCRYKLYGSYEEGLVDVLRLSKGMTQKNIAANIPFGGGKAVIFAHTDKSPELLKSFASFLNLLDGLYISAEDIGINLEDIQFIKSHSNYVFDNVDPGPYTAKGIFYSIESVIQYYFKSSLADKKIAIQGAGSVGLRLAHHLADAGALVYINDIDPTKLESIQVKNIHITDNPLTQECDVLAPCAVGGILTPSSILKLKCKIIAGGANNQLLNESIDNALFNQGITFIPDTLINSGGVIGLTKDFLKKTDSQIENELIEISKRVVTLMKLAEFNSTSVLTAMQSL